MNRVLSRAASPLCVVSPLGAQAPVDASITRVVQLQAGERLWNQGEPVSFLGVVYAGRLVKLREHARRTVVFDLLRPGDTVGEQGISGAIAEEDSVEALRRATVVLVPLHALRARMEKQPELGVKLLQRMADSMKRLSHRVEELSSGNVEARLAEVLLGLVERFGEPFYGGVLIPLRLRREDLAAMAATTHESISRRLAAWRRQGILVPQPAGYLVRDVPALKRILETT